MVWRPKVDDMEFSSLELVDRDWLVRHFESEEVLRSW